MREKINDIPKFENVKELLYHSVSKYANNIAFTVKNKVGKEVKYIDYTYTKLLEDINSFGSSLYKLNLENKKVAIVGSNSYEWVIAHLGVLLGGMVSVPLDKGLQLEELENSLIRSEAEAIVFDEKLKDTIEEIKKANKTKIKNFICFTKQDEYLDVHQLIEEGKKELDEGYTKYLDCKIDSYKMSILLFTSGTTSKSKAVMLNQNGIVTNIYDMKKVENFLPTDVNIAFLPYHHIFGSTGMLVMIASGMKTVFTDGLRYIKQNLVEYKVSLFVGVPVLIDKMHSSIMKEIDKQGKTKLINTAIKISNALRKVHIDLRKQLFKPINNALGGNMRFIISGGAPLDKKTAKWFNDVGILLVQGYGLTETSPVIAAENEKAIKYGSLGLPKESTTVKIEYKD